MKTYGKRILTIMVLVITLTLNTVEATIKKQVTFTSKNKTLVGSLYLPDDYQAGQKLPGIVVTGAWTTVKEQMPANYAKVLSDKGYAALVFDFRGWGKSDDAIKYLEDPVRKTEDIKAAAGFLATLDEIDSKRVGGLGICASSGYMIKAFTETPALKTIALVAPWLHNSDIAEEVYGGAESIQSLIATGEQAREKFEQTGEITTVSAASTTDKSAIMYQVPYYTEKDRGLIPEYDNQFNLASWESWLTFDAISLAHKLPGNIVFVHSEAAAIPDGLKQFAEIANDKVQGVWIDNVSQFDFYDQPEPIRIAVDTVVDHFQTTLTTHESDASIDEVQKIQGTIIKAVNSVDTKKWGDATRYLAESVFVDYSSMNGQAGTEVKAVDLVAGWQQLLAKASTHHILTNFEIQVNGNHAETQSHVYASHVAEGVEYWDIFGRYLHKLEKTADGWKITSITFIVHGQKGNKDFLEQISQ